MSIKQKLHRDQTHIIAGVRSHIPQAVNPATRIRIATRISRGIRTYQTIHMHRGTLTNRTTRIRIRTHRHRAALPLTLFKEEYYVDFI